MHGEWEGEGEEIELEGARGQSRILYRYKKERKSEKFLVGRREFMNNS